MYQQVRRGEWKASSPLDVCPDPLHSDLLVPFSPQPWGEKKKFTLDCVLNPIEAQDEDGNAITLLQFTQVDDFGAANRAGASVGEVLVQLNGKNINSFDDLKACIDDINKSKLSSVPVVFQGVNGQRESTITGAPM